MMKTVQSHLLEKVYLFLRGDLPIEIPRMQQFQRPSVGGCVIFKRKLIYDVSFIQRHMPEAERIAWAICDPIIFNLARSDISGHR
jgi:hypothetical protein